MSGYDLAHGPENTICIGDGPRKPTKYVEINDYPCGCLVIVGYPEKPTFYVPLYSETIDAQYCKEHDPQEIARARYAKRIERANKRRHLQK